MKQEEFNLSRLIAKAWAYKDDADIIDAEHVKEFIKEILDEIEDGESFGNYLWQQYQTSNEKVNEIIADLIRDVMSQIDGNKEMIKQKAGEKLK